MIRNPEFLKSVVADNLLTEDAVNSLVKKYKNDDFAILLHLVNKAPESTDKLGRLWGDSLGVAHVNLQKTIFQNYVLQQIPENVARSFKIIPLYKFGEAITIATHDPLNQSIISKVESIIHTPISAVFSFPSEIGDAIAIQYATNANLEQLITKIASHALFKSIDKISTEQLQQLAGDQSVIQFTQGICLLALKEKASDIHIEPCEDAVRIRYRIDGVLHEKLILEASLLPPLVTCLKIMAKLDITEKRRPQDGRISLHLSQRAVDMRFSSVQTIYGEKIVLRILGEAETKDVPALNELNFSRFSLDTIKKLLGQPNGIFFVTGPTGSGKTTTLYAGIKHINKPDINIMTIEDPVEIRLPGINQIQVNNEINFDFASALRSFLRQDPDVILVGEIRDAETARIAAQAALTGHLVLTTMHTNNAVQAVTRLMDIGIPSFLLAPSIIGAMAQRLVRKLCDNCKKKYRLSEQQCNELFIHDGMQEIFFYEAVGCEQCHHTGYSGRIAIHEIFTVSEEMRQLIYAGVSSIKINEAADRVGLKTMRYDGIKKALRGLTTIDEINRITIMEET